MSWDAALAAAGPTASRVQAEVDRWATGADSTARQVAANLRAETALPDDEFGALLRAFGAELAKKRRGGTAAFEMACRSHTLKGPGMRGPMPTVLGRAVTMERFCGWLHGRHPAISEQDFERLVRLHALPGTRPSARLRQAPLAYPGRVIWATFRNPGRDTTPFMAPLDSKEAVITALGLGGAPAGATWVMVVYRPRCDRAALRLPTVADAGMYSYFRPVMDASTAEHGWTQPLSPNPTGLDPQPEVVHGDTISYDVMLPLLVWD